MEVKSGGTGSGDVSGFDRELAFSAGEEADVNAPQEEEVGAGTSEVNSIIALFKDEDRFPMSVLEQLRRSRRAKKELEETELVIKMREEVNALGEDSESSDE